MSTAPCTSFDAFYAQVESLAYSKPAESFTAREVKEFIGNNLKWLDNRQINPTVGACLRDLAGRIRKETTDKELAEDIETIANRIHLPKDLEKLVLHNIGGSSDELNASLNQAASTSKKWREMSDQARIDCINDGEIPIRDLNIKSDRLLEFLSRFGSCITSLDLSGIEVSKEQLDTIVAKCPNLRIFVLDSLADGCDTLPSISHMQNLEELQITNCHLQRLPNNLSSCKALKSINLSATKITSLPSLSNLSSLETVYLNGCDELAEIKELQALPKLTELNCSDCLSLKTAASVEGLTNLQILYFYNCGALQSLPQGATKLPNLQELSIAYCQSLQTVPAKTDFVASIRYDTTGI